MGGGGVAPTTAKGQVAAAGSAGDVLFAEDSSQLDSNAQAVIAEAAKELTASHATSVDVVGYTDSLGGAAANKVLSLRRATAVERALEQLTGHGLHFSVKADGQAKPVASNGTATGRQLNRRVTIFAS